MAFASSSTEKQIIMLAESTELSLILNNCFIDVCMEIHAMMSSDLYGTCNSADVIVMSSTNSNLPYGTQRGCNPNYNCGICNIATVVASCKTLHWMHMADASNVF